VQAHEYADRDAARDGDRHADRDADAHRVDDRAALQRRPRGRRREQPAGVSDTDGHADPNSHRNPDRNGHGDPNGDADPDEYAVADVHDSLSDADRAAHGGCGPHRLSHLHGGRDADRRTLQGQPGRMRRVARPDDDADHYGLSDRAADGGLR
jgi:hypothetical protein